MQCIAASDDCLDVAEPVAAIILPADFETAEELDFDGMDGIALFTKKNFKNHMCLVITSNM